MVKRKINNPIVDNLHRHWGWLLGLGILLVIVGCLGMGMVVGLTLFSMYFFAGLLIFSSVSHMIDACKYNKWKGMLWQILIAFLYLIGAGVIIYDPFLSSIIITAILAWALIIIGISRIAMLLAVRASKGWGWLLFAAIASIILGVLILLQWPSNGLWIIGLFIAIEMIITGWTYIFIALALRNA